MQNTIDCQETNMTGQIERLEWSDVSKKSLREITRAKKCSSNGKCCSFGSASTDQNYCEWLMTAKTKTISNNEVSYLVVEYKLKRF